MATYSVLSSTTTVITTLTPVNAVKASGALIYEDLQLCGYPDENFINFNNEKSNTQKLFAPPLNNVWVIMPNQLNIIAIYAFSNIEYQSNAWAVPYRTSPTTFNTIGNPGESYGTTSLLAQAVGVYGGLVMLDTGDLINS
jgi:hypothetical protein